MKAPSRAERRAARIFGALLRVYPRSFRERHGVAMTSTFLETWRSSGRGVASRARFWAGSAADALRAGLAERLTPSPNGWGRSPHRNGGTVAALLADFRLAARGLLRGPGFSLLVVVTLALGIGANVAILSLVDAVLLRPLPVQQPEGLVQVFEALNGGPRGGMSYSTFRKVAADPNGTTGMAAFVSQNVEFSRGGRPGRAHVALVSGGYFPVLGVAAAAGRVLGPGDEGEPGATPVAVLSHGFWQQELGGNPAVVGSTLRLADNVFTVVGVARAGFRGVHLTAPVDLWVPVTMGAQISREGDLLAVPGALETSFLHIFKVVARLEEGRSPAEVTALLNRARMAMGEEDQPAFADPISLVPLREAATPSGRADLVRFLALLGGVVGLTLLVACVNVGTLLLVRARQRERDLAVRAALGAGSLRLFRQLATEALLLGVAGGAAAILVARGTGALLTGFALPGGVPVDLETAGNEAMPLIVALVLGIAAAVVFGTVPAWRASRARSFTALRSRDGAERRGGWGLLLSVQTGLSLVLLVGAGLFGRTLQEALRTNLGFDPEGVAALSAQLRPHGVSLAAGPALVERALDAARAHRGVELAAFAFHVPVGGGDLAMPFDALGGRGRVPGGVPVNIVTADYFRLLGIPLVAGRSFDERDAAAGAARVILVNEAAARQLWPGENPLGRQGKIVFAKEPSTVIGVVGQTLYHNLSDQDVPYVYYPLAQMPGPALSKGSFLARGGYGDAAALDGLRTAVAAIDRTLPVFEARSVERQLDDVLAPQRFGATLLGFFSVLALAIAGVGIYGVTTHTVAARRREIGIRMALGARARRVVGGVLASAMGATALGAVAGLLGALALVGLLDAFLFGITPLDPMAFAWALTALAIAALLAAALPARRAAQVDPAESMRTE